MCDQWRVDLADGAVRQFYIDGYIVVMPGGRFPGIFPFLFFVPLNYLKMIVVPSAVR